MFAIVALMLISAATTHACNQWNVLLDINALGATSQPYESAGECACQCYQDEDCAGVDVDTNSGEHLCWFHGSGTVRNIQIGAGVHHAGRPESCPSRSPCWTSWSVTLGSQAMGGAQKSDYATEEACLSACANDANCFAVDVNREDPNGVNLCWFFDEAGAAGNTQDAEKVDHFHLEESTCR